MACLLSSTLYVHFTLNPVIFLSFDLLVSSFSLFSLCFFSASSLTTLFTLLFWMLAAVSPTSNSVGVSVGASIFLTFLTLWDIYYKSNKRCFFLLKAYQLTTKCYISYLKRKAKAYLNANNCVENPSDAFCAPT